jgi:hypothetical protein
MFKVALLAIQYGMRAKSLAERLNISWDMAHEMIGQHHWNFPEYWDWIQRWLRHAFTAGYMCTEGGWTMSLEKPISERTARNWPIQSSGSELFRLALIMMSRLKIRVVAPVHDAVLIEARAEDIETEVARTRYCMERASRCVLRHLTLRTDYQIVRHPDRYIDKRGKATWEAVEAILKDIDDSIRSGRNPDGEEGILSMQRKPRLRLVPKDVHVNQEEADYLATAVTEDEIASPEPAPPFGIASTHGSKGRQFRRFDETWAERLLAADPPVSRAVWRIALVLLAEADFNRKIKVSDEITKTARLTQRQKRAALERLEAAGIDPGRMARPRSRVRGDAAPSRPAAGPEVKVCRFGIPRCSKTGLKVCRNGRPALNTYSFSYWVLFRMMSGVLEVGGRQAESPPSAE